MICFCLKRIQQIQLLGRDLRGPNHENLWNQLEAEIHLHRHKTVIRACRGREKIHRIIQTPDGHVIICICRVFFVFFCCCLNSLTYLIGF